MQRVATNQCWPKRVHRAAFFAVDRALVAFLHETDRAGKGDHVATFLREFALLVFLYYELQSFAINTRNVVLSFKSIGVCPTISKCVALAIYVSLGNVRLTSANTDSI